MTETHCLSNNLSHQVLKAWSKVCCCRHSLDSSMRHARYVVSIILSLESFSHKKFCHNAFLATKKPVTKCIHTDAYSNTEREIFIITRLKLISKICSNKHFFIMNPIQISSFFTLMFFKN